MPLHDGDEQGGVTMMAGSGGQDPRVGTVAAGKYRILRIIGGGGMGRIYEAQNVAIGKRVALKFVVVGRDDAAARTRFHREARAVAAVDSAHIVQIFDTGETEAGEPFLVMELLQGEDLAARLGRGRLSAADALAVAAHALRGLRRAHAAGIVHRDLKPENLFLVAGDDERLHVKIVDFGLSKLATGLDGAPEVDPLTRDGAVLGTPLYMPPEQIEGAPDVDHRADLWSLGAILYEAIAGAPPFVEPSYARLVIHICQRDPQPLAARAPGVSAAVSAIVARAMARDRAQRFQSAEEFLGAVLAALPDPDRARSSIPDLDRSMDRASRPSLPDPVEVSLDGVALASGNEARSRPAPSSGDRPPSPAPGAELRTFTQSAATLWLSQSPTFSIWRGEVAAPDRLRVEARDGGVHELRLEPVGVLRLGRTERVGEERNELVYADVASRLAATLRHDGVRWWLRRRDECSVPVQVGARSLARGEEAPLVHGTFVSVGGMRATLVDRRFVTPVVPAGTVDTATGLLGRAGMEQEIASFLQRRRPGALILLRLATAAPPLALSATETDLPRASLGAGAAAHPPAVAVPVALHRAWPSLPVGAIDGVAVLLVPGESDHIGEVAAQASEMPRAAGLPPFACGYWLLAGDGLDAGREIELALHAVERLAEGGVSGQPGGGAGAAPMPLRQVAERAHLATSAEILSASADARRTTLLFAIEEQSALGGVGPHVVAALEKELSAVIATHAGAGTMVGPLAPGVVVACVSRKLDPAATGNRVQCDWHARPPVLDGKAELPRTLSWEVLHGVDAATRAAELARECADPHGVLSALAGGLPYPIAGRVHAAIASSSAVERVKMLFDVLEGTWRFIATVLASAAFARRPSGAASGPPSGPGSNEIPPGFEPILEIHQRLAGRDGYALGTWRELARAAAKGFADRDDPIGAMARDVVGVRLGHNQTFETLSNLMQVERNTFAHGHYNEARAATDLPEFEQMTRTLLRALRPLCAWTLVTVEKTEPDLYGDLQTVEFIDHTGPFNTGTRRRIGLNSPVRLANVVYLARWREGLVLPLEPMVKRLPHADRYDLFWMDHLPRAGACQLSSAVGGDEVTVTCDPRRLPPLVRAMIERTPTRDGGSKGPG